MGTGRLMENFAIHPSQDVIVGFSIEETHVEEFKIS
jgi:hypothetical protein